MISWLGDKRSTYVQYAMDAGKAWIADCYASIEGLNCLNALPGVGYLLTTPKASQPVRVPRPFTVLDLQYSVRRT